MMGEMTLKRLHEILFDITLPTGWKTRVTRKGDGFNVQFVFDAPDSDTGEMVEQRCRKWYISSHATLTEVVRTVHKAGHAALLHEFDETFKYHGTAVFHPHRDIETLLAMIELDKRQDPVV